MDYTTLDNVKLYDDSEGIRDDQLIRQLITGYSRQVDRFCHQTFERHTNAAYKGRGAVNQHGSLLLTLPSPTVVTLSSLAYISPLSGLPTALNVDTVDIEDRPDGTWVRTRPGAVYCQADYVRVTASYIGGWDSLDEIPADFELMVRRLVWWGYKHRSTSGDTTAMPELGVLIVPGSWPPDIKDGFKPFTRWVV